MGKITILGDLMCKGNQAELLKKKFGRYAFEDYVGGLKPLLDGSDYAIGNLETPVCASPRVKESDVSFNTPVEFLSELRRIGLEFLTLANNHCLDCGVKGLSETVANVRDAGFAYDGAFLSVEDASTVRVFEVKGVKIALVNSTFGTNSELNGVILDEADRWRVALLKSQRKPLRLADPVVLDGSGDCKKTYFADSVLPTSVGNPKNEAILEGILAKIEKARRDADIVIAMPHVGGQYNPGPGVYAKYIVGRMKEKGADIVIAGHPHVVHRCSRWTGDGAFCAYSLGNTCFTPGMGNYLPNVLGDYSVVLHLHIDESSKKVARITFNIVKNVVDEYGLAHVRPVYDIFGELKNATARERLAMEVEAVVGRFAGIGGDIEMQAEYEFPQSAI